MSQNTSSRETAGGIVRPASEPVSVPRTDAFFMAPLKGQDSLVHDALSAEAHRQREQLELLAPKNYTSRATRDAFASMVAFTTVEGYPGRRFHAGMVNLDVVERAAIDRARALFGCRYANVQPHSGTQANQAVFFSLLEPGDRVLSMALRDGGHLSHGLRANFSGRWFSVETYGVDPVTGLIDYEGVADAARRHRPKLIIAGGSSYPRAIDFAAFREIADEVGAYLMADISHFSGLVAAGIHPNPFPHAHVVTTTTNKNLRGPRGGLVLADDDELGKALDSAVFPGIQGGPLPEYIAAKAVAFGEALEAEFEDYASAVLGNARLLASTAAERGYHVVTGGTDTPLIVIDLRSVGLTGNVASESLERAGIPCNKNLVPGDTEKPSITSGLRFGTSAITTRGLRGPQVRELAGTVCDVMDGLRSGRADNTDAERAAREKVSDMAFRFPIHADV